MVLAHRRPGVRAAWRWMLEGRDGIEVTAEAGTVAAARAVPGDVVVTGLAFDDGTAADLLAGPLPVVVVTTLPADERPGVDLGAAAAVLRTGTLRRDLVAAVRAAGGPAGEASLG